MLLQKPKLLLINPKFPESFWSFSWTFDKVIPNQRTSVPPLGLATLAALSPQDWDIEIIDENIEPIDWDKEATMVGVCGMSVQYQRQCEILTEFKRRGKFVIAGGSFASLCPEKYTLLCHSVIAGEAEYEWPRFCQDYLQGKPGKLYQESGNVDLKDSPTPRHDLIKWRYYLSATIQFSRGCPYQCEFCDIIVTFGRKPRTKSLAQIEAELDSLRQHGVRNIVFVDDNLIGNLPQAKKLLLFLIDYQKKHRYQFSFGTEATINIAAKPEFLKLLRQANFAWIFVGIESPDMASLEETKKSQNTWHDLIESVYLFYQHGIDVFGGFIVGFDNDDKSIFDKQYDFIVRSGIIIAMVGQLYAPPKTPLYKRLQESNRLRAEVGEEATLINAGAATNVIPLNMTSEELQMGCWDLHKRLLRDEAIYQRIRNKLHHLNNPSNYHFPIQDWLRILYGLLAYGILPGGWSRWKFFSLSILQAFKRPLQAHKLIRTVIADWSNALPLRMYADKTFVVRQHQQYQHLFERLQHMPARFPFVLDMTIADENYTKIVALLISGRLSARQQITAFNDYLQSSMQAADQLLLHIRHIDEQDYPHLRLLLQLLLPLRHQLLIKVDHELYRQLRDELWPFSCTLEKLTRQTQAIDKLKDAV